MKKAIAIVLTAILALGVFAFNVPVSKAASNQDDSLYVKITPNPSSLSAGDTVTFSVTAKNKLSDQAITDVTIDFGSKQMAAVASIAAGSSASKSFDMKVNTDQLGTDLTFNVGYNVGGAPGEFEVTTQIDKSLPQAELTWKCVANRKSAPSGSKVNFTFTLQNTGDTALTNVELSLPPVNSSKKVKTIDSIAPSATKTYVYEFTLTEDEKVTPTVKYTAYDGTDNEKTETSTKPVIALTVANPDLDLKLTADNTKPAAGADVTFSLSIENIGNVAMKNIDVYDHLQQKIKTGLTLGTGKKTTISGLKYQFTQTTEVQFSVTCEDSDGTGYNPTSNKLSISVPTDQTKIKLDLKAEATPAELTEPGKVTFNVTVTNSGSYPLTDIVITEATLGQIATLDSLEPGVDKLFPYEADIKEAGTYTFKVTAKDADGNSHDQTAEPVEIKLTAAAASPSDNPLESATDLPSESASASAVKGSDTLGTIIIIMIIIGVLIVAVVVALVIMVNREKKGGGRPSAPSGGGSGKPMVSKAVKYKNKNDF